MSTPEAEVVEEPETVAPPDTNGSGQQLARRPDRTPLSQRDPVSIAKHFAASGYFRDTTSMSQAVVKIAAGEELGLGPMAAIQGLTIIEGKLGMTANLMATLVQQHPRFSYRVVETTEQESLIAFHEDGEEIGQSHFELADAQRAGLVKPNSNWQKWPKAMCFARALTQGVRTYCPSVTAGAPAYTVEELHEVVDVEPIEEPTAEVAGEPVEAKLDHGRVNTIMEGLELIGASVADAQQLLGAAGLNSELRAKSRKALRERIEQLDLDEAEALEVEISNEADRDG